MDGSLEKYIQFLHNSGKKVMEATMTVFAVQHASLNLNGQLKPAWGDIRSWQMELHSQLRVPMPKIICLAIFRWSLLHGLVISHERGAEWVPLP
eukprot:10818167-Heterocapsa_arctica.AAC.1